MDVVFLPMQKMLLEIDHKIILYFKHLFSVLKPIANNVVMSWKSVGLSDQSIKPPAISGNSVNLRLHYFNNPNFHV